MQIFETHCHLDLEQFNKDRDQVIARAQQAGVEKLINIGFDIPTSKSSIALAQKYSFIYATVGFHPHEAQHYDEEAIKQLATNKKVVAIGEIGLDYYRNLSPKDVQQKVFKAQIKLAQSLGLPVVIHDRDAHEDCFAIMSEAGVKQAVFHCFAGDAAFARKVLDKGWYISFTGTVTYKNSNLGDVIAMVPKDRFFVETDCPYLPPQTYRGKRNEPSYLRLVVQKIADIKRVPPLMVAKAAYNNACQFFNV